MDTRVGYQVGLELGQIHVQGTIETKRRSNGGNDLANEAVQVDIAGSFDVQVAVANVVDGLVVYHESTVGVLQSGVGGQDGVVGFHHSSGYLRSRVDGEFQFRFLSIVHGETLHQQRSESGASSTTERAEHQEPLKACALVC